MARAKRRRTRTAHPGVKLLKRVRKDGETWAARWRDPDTGRPQHISLTRLGLTSAEACRAWAIEKSNALAERRRKIAAGGGCEVRPWPVQEAVKDYLERASERLEAVTVRGYRGSLALFKAWAEKAGIRTLLELRPAHLSALRDELARKRKRVAASGGNRGQRRKSAERRSPASVNTDLLKIRIFLHEARRLGRTPYVDRDAVSDALKGIRGERSRPAFLRPAELRELLEACLRHDADCYTLTRLEKDGDGPPGTTPKHLPAAPFVLFVLLSGCRLGEARALRWEWCYLSGTAPEVILPAKAVKTRHERSVDLAVSPSLVKLLQVLRLRSGGAPYVFGGDLPLALDLVNAARRRLEATYGAPAFTWQKLRSTCATYLANSPGIYGAASIFLEARRLGHSVTVSEQRYSGTFREIAKDATTLEKAMRIEELAARIVAAAGGGGEVMTTENELATGTAGQ